MGYDRNVALNIARGELGYHEKASNAFLDDKTANSGSGNYTKYARDLDALGYFYNGKKQGFAYCDLGYDWTLVKAYGVEAALKLLCQPRYSAGAGCYYSAMYYKQCGQFYGPGTIPEPADQIFFTYKSGEVSHTGLVESVSGNQITTIEFNTSDMVARRYYTVGQSRIYGYGRPKWDDGWPATIQHPTSASEKEVDMLAREVIDGKWGDGAERVAGLTAAGYDYTAVQQRVNEILSGTSTPVAQEYAAGTTIEALIFNFCRDTLGLCTAAICGALANIYEESKFKTDEIGDSGTSYGICQWHATRYSSLKSWCSENGKDYTALDGQLWYMKHELETTHAAVLKRLKAVEDTAQGAYDAGYVWCSIFEVPADTEAKSEDRGNIARFTYWPKYNGIDTVEALAADQQQTQQDTQEAGAYTLRLNELKEGDKGDAVKRVQTLLIARGYYCGGKKNRLTGAEIPDGEYGPTTKKAVMKIQAAKGLKVDGVVGHDTMLVLLT